MDKDFGPYELRDRIGKGGMAWVYLANQKNLDRLVALKILFPHLAEDEKLVARFQLEARSAAQMRHENVCQVYDFGRHGEQFYIAMEYVEGLNLRDWIDRKGTPPLEISLLMLRDICRGLEHAHSRSIIHRDIKPSNVMFTPEGVIKLMDFGLARRAEENTGITMVGSMLGTPAYMSPEQARGEKLDRATTDIFSFGIVCYELLSGTRPFQGDTSSIARAILYAEPRPLDALDPLVPPGVEGMIRRMLEKDAATRVQSVTEVRKAFDAAVAELGIAAHDRGLLADYAENPEKVGGALRAKRLARHLENAREAEARGDEAALLRENRCVAYLDPTNRAASDYVREHGVPWPVPVADEDLERTVLIAPEGPGVASPAGPGGAAAPPGDATVVAPPAAATPSPPAMPPPAAPAGAPAAKPEPSPVPAAKDAPGLGAAAPAKPGRTPPAAGKAAPSSGKAAPAARAAGTKGTAPPAPAGKPAPSGGAKPPVPLLVGGALVAVLAVVLGITQPWKRPAPVTPPEPERVAADSVRAVEEPDGIPLALPATLVVEATPPDASVSLDGGAFVPAPARFADLDPRDHTVRVRRDSFQTARRVVRLAAGRETTLTVALRPQTAAVARLGTLVIQTVPPDATVSLDGERAVSAPARFRNLSEGEHTLEVRREGYEPRTLALVARAAPESTLTVALAALRRAGVAPRGVTVRTQPAGAEVTLDGSNTRREPARFEGVEPGDHVVRARRQGVPDAETFFGLTGLRDTTITLRFDEAAAGGPTATLLLWARPPADFYVERQLKGRGLDSVRVTVPANREQLVYIKESSPWFGATAQTTVRPRPGEFKYVGSDFTADGARLEVTTPGRAGAEVLVDGRPTGLLTPATLYLSPGQHRIHVEWKGWKSREGEQSLRFRAGQSVSQSFTMEPE